MSRKYHIKKSKYIVEGNVDFPEEFPLDYFEKLYQKGNYNLKEILLGIIAVLNKECRKELWHEFLKNSSIFKSVSSFNDAHDHLGLPRCHMLTNSIKLIGVNRCNYNVFQITDEGMNHIKVLFPEIYKYLNEKKNSLNE